jgi:hypothetical protein
MAWRSLRPHLRHRHPGNRRRRVCQDRMPSIQGTARERRRERHQGDLLSTTA